MTDKAGSRHSAPSHHEAATIRPATCPELVEAMHRFSLKHPALPGMSSADVNADRERVHTTPIT